MVSLEFGIGKWRGELNVAAKWLNELGKEEG